MPSPSRESIQEGLDLAANGGRAAAEARLLRWREEHPTLPCGHCAGRGSYLERGGVRRPFSPDGLDPALDRYEGSCPECRGFGYRSATHAEVAAHRAALLERDRDAYRAVRAAACKGLGLSRKKFDRLVRARIASPAPAPAHWLAAARALAAEFGVQS